MTSTAPHTLVLVTAYLSGAQEWSCPDCGFRLLRTRLPEEQYIVLVPGETPSVHQDYSSLPSASVQANVLPPAIAPWLDWIDQIDFDDLKD
jgi:hypothetical protein